MGNSILNELMAGFQLNASGQIINLQTTYIDIEYSIQTQQSGITKWRIHFRGKKSFFLERKSFSNILVRDSHPLLLEFNEPRKSLFFASTPNDAVRLAEELEQAWQRNFENRKEHNFTLSKLTEKGPGLFYAGPASFVDAAFPILQSHGMRPTALGGRPPTRQSKILLLGRHYVIAEQFHAAVSS